MGPAAARALPTFDQLYAELADLPAGVTGEILGPGELRLMSRPGGRHRFGAQRIAHALRGHNLVVGGSGWWIEPEAEIRLSPDRLYVPDLSGWRVEEAPDFVDENPIPIPPDWACEILSRSTQRADRVLKLPHYASAGVGHVWVVDPDLRTVEVYEAREGAPALVASAREAAVIALPPFSLPIDVGSLWKPVRG